MAARKSGLGRGLDALIPVARSAEGYSAIPVDRIAPNPVQPRRHFDEESLEELAASIGEVGVLQPVVVEALEDGRYQLIAGERRWRAARLAGLGEIPAVVRTVADSGRLTEALIENIHREDLTALEAAAAYEQLLEDFGMTHEEVGKRVGKSRAAVTNTLRLLQLPAAVQGMLNRGELTAGHARALLGLDDTSYAQHVAKRAADEGWSVRQVEDAVRARNEQPTPSAPAKPRPIRPEAIIQLEGRLSERLGTPVKIDYRGSAGKISIRFRSLDDLERIYKELL